MHSEVVAEVRWFDLDSLPPVGVDRPSHVVLVHETAHDGVQATLAFVELLDVGQYSKAARQPSTQVSKCASSFLPRPGCWREGGGEAPDMLSAGGVHTIPGLQSGEDRLGDISHIRWSNG